MQAREGLQYIGADFMGLRHEAFIPSVPPLDIFYRFMADKEYNEFEIR